jgi:hypothetical protein
VQLHRERDVECFVVHVKLRTMQLLLSLQ